MGKTSYEVNTSAQSYPQNSGQPPQFVYNNPTFSTSDLDKDLSDKKATDTFHENNVTIEIQQPLSEMAKFSEVPRSKGDNIKFAILVAFPLIFFIVGIIVTGTST